MEKTASSSVKKRALSTSQMALIGVMTAVTCILGPFAIPIPISPVPISFTNLAVYLTVYVLGMKAGTISYLIICSLDLQDFPYFQALQAVWQSWRGQRAAIWLDLFLWQS